jgi:PAS domain S-box-containing protein
VLIEQIQEGAVTLGTDGTVLYCNRRLAGMLGQAQERIIGRALRPLITPEDWGAFDRLLDDAWNMVARRELSLLAAGDVRVPVYMSLSLLRSEDGVMLLCGVLTDLTEQKLHLRELADTNARLHEEIAERERVEQALRQSQKMEAVGQLTGGLAHDFNNLLVGISGSLELLQARIAQGRIKDVDRYINAAQGAAKRAAALTHRLLAFSRRQTLDPKPTDVNRLVAGMEELICRTMGPEVSVEPIAGGGLWTTLVDPSQLENALLNLCINARDAMSGGGKLVIETGNRWLDEHAARERELPVGQYVTLCISDNGIGMPPEVIARAFDPFFTTKPIGMGTGLGLSMVYGFARQSGGQARIYSEVGQGTMVCLYLPRYHGESVVDIPAELSKAPRAEHDEMVLVVDDEPTVRMLVTEVLEDLGYTAIEAADGAAGLKVLRSDVRIDLLVTDVGLPGGMNGRQLADAARVARPGLKVLFITGYAENAVLSHGHLEPGTHVLTKPFALDVLATRMRALIADIAPGHK